MKRLGLLAASAALLAACAGVPRPDSLTAADRMSQGAGAEESKAYAPAAFAHAEKVRRDSHRGIRRFNGGANTRAVVELRIQHLCVIAEVHRWHCSHRLLERERRNAVSETEVGNAYDEIEGGVFDISHIVDDLTLQREISLVFQFATDAIRRNPA